MRRVNWPLLMLSSIVVVMFSWMTFSIPNRGKVTGSLAVTTPAQCEPDHWSEHMEVCGSCGEIVSEVPADWTRWVRVGENRVELAGERWWVEIGWIDGRRLDTFMCAECTKGVRDGQALGPRVRPLLPSQRLNVEEHLREAP